MRLGDPGAQDDLHAVWCATAVFAGMSVLAFDIPGTGEATVPMSVESAEVVSGLVREARRIGNGKVAHLGISMGGHFSARSALNGEVDAAVDYGGPVRAAFGDHVNTFSVGAMGGILGSALGFDAPPSSADLRSRWNKMSLAALLEDEQHATPLLVVNGADDPLIPQEDTLLFEGRPGAEVHLVPDSGHCAAEKIGEVTPMVIGWLAQTMAALP